MPTSTEAVSQTPHLDELKELTRKLQALLDEGNQGYCWMEAVGKLCSQIGEFGPRH